MRLRVFSMIALLLLFGAAGCERPDAGAVAVEKDEPGYRRGKDLWRQGRNQEALNEYLKVIEKRGLNNAPEAHLEAGLIYSEHFKDPIAAIYHFRKYRELMPNSPQYDLVRQRIEAATREFSRTLPLPAQPSDVLIDRRDLGDIQRLQRENQTLKAELAALRGVPLRPESGAATATAAPSSEEETPVAREPVYASDVAPVTRSPVQPAGAITPAAGPVSPVRQAPSTATQPARPAATQASVATPPVASPRPAQAATTYRRHVVVAKDNLYSLSQRYYGTRSRWRDIYAANRDVLRSENDPLRIGMALRIPQ